MILLVVALASALAGSVRAQTASGCSDCPLPLAARRHLPRDSTFDVYFTNGRLPIRRVTAVKRETTRSLGRLVQALQIQFLENGVCRDTLVPIEAVERLGAAGVGLEGQTISIPLLPAREFYREDLLGGPAENYLEIGGDVRFAGSDTSSREVGFPAIAFGGHLALGRRLASWLDAAVTAGAELERSRLRIPITARLRFHPFGSVRVEPYFRYSDPCWFGLPGDPASAPEGSFVEVPAQGRVDSAVYFTSDIRTIRDSFRPFFYLEGGIIVDGGFEGAGPTPSVNSDAYGQFLAGAGAGLPLFDVLAISLGYRFTRMNFRTPCEACGEKFLVNTSVAHSVLLSVAYVLDF